MTRDDAGTILGNTIKEIVFSTEIEDYRDKQKIKLLEAALAKNGFPFEDTNVMKELIPICDTWIRLFLDEALESDDAGKLFFGRSADMFRVSQIMLKKHTR